MGFLNADVDEKLRDICLEIEDRYQLKFLEIGTLTYSRGYEEEADAVRQELKQICTKTKG